MALINNVVVAVFDTLGHARHAVSELEKYGLDAIKVSILARNLQAGSDVGAAGIDGTPLDIDTPEHNAFKYEIALKKGQYLLRAQGTAAETERAREIIRSTGPRELHLHSTESEMENDREYTAAAA